MAGRALTRCCRRWRRSAVVAGVGPAVAVLVIGAVGNESQMSAMESASASGRCHRGSRRCQPSCCRRRMSSPCHRRRSRAGTVGRRSTIRCRRRQGWRSGPSCCAGRRATDVAAVLHGGATTPLQGLDLAVPRATAVVVRVVQKSVMAPGAASAFGLFRTAMDVYRCRAGQRTGGDAEGVGQGVRREDDEVQHDGRV